MLSKPTKADVRIIADEVAAKPADIESFFEVVVDIATKDDVYPQLSDDGTVIHPNWRPKPKTVLELVEFGLAPKAITAQLDSFIVYWTKRGESRDEYDSRFIIHAKSNAIKGNRAKG